jgi:hypothetical protein
MIILNPSATQSFYYRYPKYLQPTPSLGSGSRVFGSAALGTRPKFGGIQRIYNFYKQYYGSDAFFKEVAFAIYGVQR